MHTGPMPESAGTFSDGKMTDKPCGKCGEKKVRMKFWDSSCGGYTDLKFTCDGCGHVWWVDGPDS